MQAAEHPNSDANPGLTEPTTWTYPTRFCRICREDVPATVTMYPPGLPMQLQKPIVEYRNDDEYGRLIKPCHCRGSSRYIHELCLLRSRTENRRAGSMWKCHECGYQFNFKRLAVQRYLSNWYTVSALTILFMVLVVFVLGFIADPIINIYMDPYQSLVGKESIWDELEVRSVMEHPVSQWSQHFAKGFISMGLVGFMKTLFLNPFQWVNLRFGGSLSSTRGTTGRDRAVSISWIAIVIGVCSAFAFFYKFVQAIVQRSLQRIGNNIVDTQLSGDNDDLKPPPGWKHRSAGKPRDNSGPQSGATNTAAEHKLPSEEPFMEVPQQSQRHSDPKSTQAYVAEPDPDCSDKIGQAPLTQNPSTPCMSGSWVDVDTLSGGNDENILSGVQRQGWSFSNL